MRPYHFILPLVLLLLPSCTPTRHASTIDAHRAEQFAVAVTDTFATISSTHYADGTHIVTHIQTHRVTHLDTMGRPTHIDEDILTSIDEQRDITQLDSTIATQNIAATVVSANHADTLNTETRSGDAARSTLQTFARSHQAVTSIILVILSLFAYLLHRITLKSR